jgi:GINS complex subunit 3
VFLCGSTFCCRLWSLTPSSLLQRTLQDIEAGSMVELPLWMAQAFSKRNIVRVDLPRSFSARNREALAAQPSAVRLRDHSPWFYGVGLLLSTVSVHPEAARLPSSTRSTLAARAANVIDVAQHSLHEDVSSFTTTLTNAEQALFRAGYGFAKERAQWKRRDHRLGGGGKGMVDVTNVGVGGRLGDGKAAIRGVKRRMHGSAVR